MIVRWPGTEAVTSGMDIFEVIGHEADLASLYGDRPVCRPRRAVVRSRPTAVLNSAHRP